MLDKSDPLSAELCTRTGRERRGRRESDEGGGGEREKGFGKVEEEGE